MHNQFGVGKLYGRAHLTEDVEAFGDSQLLVLTPQVDAQAFDELHHDVRHAVARGAAVKQCRDVGVFEARQYLPFATKSPLQLGVIESNGQRLDRNTPIELWIDVVAPRIPHPCRPVRFRARCDHPHHRANQPRILRRELDRKTRAWAEEGVILVVRQQLLRLAKHGRFVTGQRSQQNVPLGWRHGACRVKQFGDASPLLRTDRHAVVTTRISDNRWSLGVCGTWRVVFCRCACGNIAAGGIPCQTVVGALLFTLMSSDSDTPPFSTSTSAGSGSAPLEAESVTQLLRAHAEGDPDAAESLATLVYGELHVLAVAAMRGEADGHTLQPTELVHAAFTRLVTNELLTWQNRHQFYGAAALAMRRLLVDHARSRRQLKRDGGVRIPLTVDVGIVEPRDVDVLDLNDALDKLARLDARQVQVVELRYFGGFSIDETAAVLHVSPATVKRDWAVARAFLRQALAEYADERERS